jgi:MFS family permease
VEPLLTRASRTSLGLSQSSQLAAVFAASFGVGLIFGFQPPLMAVVLERGGASSFEIGAVTGASTIAVIAFGPVYPRLIARLGLRRAIVIGTVIAVAAVFVMPWLETVWAWSALRFITGCALGISWIASEIWLNTISTEQSRGTVMSMYATAFAAGVMAGPLLLQLTGTAGSQPFQIGALCLALTTLPVLFVRNALLSDQGPDRAPGLRRVLLSAPVVMLAALIAGLVESVDIALLPVFGLHKGLDERSSLFLIAVFLAGNVILQVPIGALADRLGRRLVLAVCSGASVIGPLLLPSLMSAPLLLWPLLFVWGGTLYGFYTQGIALLGESFAERELASANTAFVVVYCAGGVVGPTLAGLAMDAWNPNGLLVFVSGAASLLIVGLLAEARLRPRR